MVSFCQPLGRALGCSGGHSCSRCFWEHNAWEENLKALAWILEQTAFCRLGFLYHSWSQGMGMRSHCPAQETGGFKMERFLYILKPHFTHPWKVLQLVQYWAFIAIFTEHEASSWTLLPNLGRRINVRAFFYYCPVKIQGWDSFHSTVADCMGKVSSQSFNSLLFSFLSSPLFQPLSALPPPLPSWILPSSWHLDARERGWAE